MNFVRKLWNENMKQHNCFVCWNARTVSTYIPVECDYDLLEEEELKCLDWAQNKAHEFEQIDEESTIHFHCMIQPLRGNRKTIGFLYRDPTKKL